MKRRPPPKSITIILPLVGRDWYSLKAQMRGARKKSVEEYVYSILFAAPFPREEK